MRRRSSATPIPISRQTSLTDHPTSSSPPSMSRESTPPAHGIGEQSILRRTRPRVDSNEKHPDQSVQFAAQTARPLRRRGTRDSGNTERLPPNASGSAVTSADSTQQIRAHAPHSPGSPHHRSQSIDFPHQAAITSTSAPTRDSPFIRRYLNGETGTSPSNALGRRLSLSQTTRARAWTESTGIGAGGRTTGHGADDLTMAQMMAMIQGLVQTVDRLEKKLDGKGKETDLRDDESAIDDDDDSS